MKTTLVKITANTFPVVPVPPKEYLYYFHERTDAHVKRVQLNLGLLSTMYPKYEQELKQRGAEHDWSKYGDKEKRPYIWLTWWHKCKNENIPFDYPDGVKDFVKKATKHHILTNKHHPESHKSLADMSFVDIAEMVCDWMAMSQELHDSIDEWVAKVVGKKYKFSPEQTKLIYKLVKQLKTRSE